MLPPFPKIFSLGQVYIKNILDGPIEITEKLDGSAFSFGNLDGTVSMRSKRAQLFGGMADKMFVNACSYIEHIQDRLPNGKIFHAEMLNKPHHNSLKYNNVPRNGMALYGIRDLDSGSYEGDYTELKRWADRLEIDIVPLLYLGRLATMESIKGFLDRESYLGGTNIEGIVIKNYTLSMFIAGQFIPIMAGKYVSEAFKEQSGDGKKEHTNTGKWEGYKLAYRTEARWNKAIQHLRDDGSLLGEPKDIGPLIKEVQGDITEEHEDEIKEFLWDHFGKELLRLSTAGLPEYYKNYLLEGHNA